MAMTLYIYDIYTMPSIYKGIYVYFRCRYYHILSTGRETELLIAKLLAQVRAVCQQWRQDPNPLRTVSALQR